MKLELALARSPLDNQVSTNWYCPFTENPSIVLEEACLLRQSTGILRHASRGVDQ